MAKLQAMAEAEGLKLSDMIRRAVRQMLAQIATGKKAGK